MLDGFSARLRALLHSVSGLQDVLRKAQQPPDDALASVFGWLFAVANHYPDLFLGEAMAEKYPESGCAYCHFLPCRCQVTWRSESKPMLLATSHQSQWPTFQWQKHLKAVYGLVNESLSLDVILSRLFREVGEVSNAEARRYSLVREAEREIAKELADVLAWLLALANRLELNLGRLTESHYHRWFCPNCSPPTGKCVCGHVEALLVLPTGYGKVGTATL